MERYAKGFRSFGSFLVLLHLIVFFLPLTERTQEGYTTLRWSQYQYVKAMFSKSLPFVGERAVPVTGTQIVFILCCMVLPLVLALAAGVWGIVGSPRQWGSSVLILVISIVYIVSVGSLDILWPDAQQAQVYERGIACTGSIVISVCSAVMAVMALVSTPKKVKKVQQKIPQVQEIKQQQAEARYNIVMSSEKDQRPADQEPGISKGSHGMMVGLTGIYAGAQIPMPDGEFIGLGRQNTNHLIFEGQPKVSRDHCKIKWDASNEKYIIWDYSSTGSFANGSHDCLPQNLELALEPGTVIAIGDDTNTFRLG